MTHLVVTFVPASLCDLKLLMLSQACLEGTQPRAVKMFPSPAKTEESDVFNKVNFQQDVL